MKKILIISNMYPSPQKPYSGIFVLNQYEYLKKHSKNSVELFAMKRTFTSKVGSLIKYGKAIFRFTPMYFKKFDIIHVHYFYPLILLAIMYKAIHPKTRIIVTFHGSDIADYFTNRIERKFFKFLLSKVNVVIAVGAELGDLIENKLGRKCDAVLSAGVDNDIFYKEEGPIDKKYDFIFVGSFIERKGVDILIKAIETTGKSGIKYCFVGSGAYKEAIANLAREYDVTLLENQTQTQLRKLYNQSKFFILPSRDEPFGLVATEALFCGVPVIVSANGGLKDQVKEGVNGFVIETNVAGDYAAKIKALYVMPDNDYEQLAKNALKSNKEHSLKAVCTKLNLIYTEELQNVNPQIVDNDFV